MSGVISYTLKLNADNKAALKAIGTVDSKLTELSDTDVLIDFKFNNAKELNKQVEKISKASPELGIQFQYDINKRGLLLAKEQLAKLEEIDVNVETKGASKYIDELRDNLLNLYNNGASEEELAAPLQNLLNVTKKLDEKRLKNIGKEIGDIYKKYDNLRNIKPIDLSNMGDIEDLKLNIKDFESAMKSLRKKGAIDKSEGGKGINKLEEEASILEDRINSIQSGFLAVDGKGFLSAADSASVLIGKLKEILRLLDETGKEPQTIADNVMAHIGDISYIGSKKGVISDNMSQIIRTIMSGTGYGSGLFLSSPKASGVYETSMSNGFKNLRANLIDMSLIKDQLNQLSFSDQEDEDNALEALRAVNGYVAKLGIGSDRFSKLAEDGFIDFEEFDNIDDLYAFFKDSIPNMNMSLNEFSSLIQEEAEKVKKMGDFDEKGVFKKKTKYNNENLPSDKILDKLGYTGFTPIRDSYNDGEGVGAWLINPKRFLSNDSSSKEYIKMLDIKDENIEDVREYLDNYEQEIANLNAEIEKKISDITNRLSDFLSGINLKNAEPEMPEINTNTKSLKELVELYHQLGTSGGAKEELDKISGSILEIVQAENKLDPGQMQQFVEVLRGLTFVDGDNPISKIPYTVEEAISAFEKLSKAKQTLNESSLSEGKDSGVKEAEAAVDKAEEAVKKVKEVSTENEKATEKTKELNESFEKGEQISREAISNEESSLSNLKAALEDVVSRVDAKTRAFQEEGMIVDSVVQEEVTQLDKLSYTLHQLIGDIDEISNIFKSINLDNINLDSIKLDNIKLDISDTKLDGVDELTERLNGLINSDDFISSVDSIDTGLRLLQDTVNNLSIKDNSFFDNLNKILEDGEKLKNLAKVLSASEKKIKAASREAAKEKKKKKDEYDEKEAIKNESIVEGKIKAKLKELENVENVSIKRALDSHGHLVDALITAEEKRFNEQTQKWEAVVNKYNIKPEFSSVESDVDYTRYNEKRLNEETKINNRIAKDSENKINSIKEKAEGFHTVLQNLFNSGKYTKDFNDDISKTQSKIEALFEAIKNGKGVDELSDAFNDIKKDFDKINFEKSLGGNIQSASVQIEKLRRNLLALKNDFPNMKGDELIRFNSLDKLISDFKEMKNVSRDALSATASDILKLRNDLEDVGNAGKGFWDKVRNRSSDMSAKFIGQYLSLQDIVRYTREAVNTIRELDTQLVDLRKTTTMSEFDLNEFYLTSNDIAKSMGVTTSQIIEQASAWSRLGYSTKEASETMATLSSQFASISPGTTVENATDYLVSAMQAFGISTDEVERKLMDNINAIGNSMATTNGEIGEMLLRSSAAMKAANNSIEETIALESAAVQITRNAETTGTAFRTVSMRIRGYDEETEELSDDLKNISGDIADLTKTAEHPIGISLFTDETKTEYKSTYEILKEIAGIWNELTDKQQAGLLEKLAGKRGGQVLAGVLNNFGEVEKAMQTMSEAEGSADREMGIITDSIDFKLNRLKETWVGTLQGLIDRGDIGKIIDFLTTVSELLGQIIDTIGLVPTSIISGGIIGYLSSEGFSGWIKDTIQGIKDLNAIQNGMSLLPLDANRSKNLQRVEGFFNFGDKTLEKLENSSFTKSLTGYQMAANGAVQSTEQLGVAAAGASTSLAATEASTVGLSSTLTGLINPITAVIAVLGGVIMVEKSFEAAYKDHQRASESFVRNYESLNDEVSASNDNFNNLAQRYDELSKGVDNLGNNVSLSKSEFEEYKNVCNSIAELSPDLVAGWDEENNAIIKHTENLKKDAEAYRDNTRAKYKEQYEGEDKDKTLKAVKDDLNVYGTTYTSLIKAADDIKNLSNLTYGELKKKLSSFDDEQKGYIEQAIKENDLDISIDAIDAKSWNQIRASLNDMTKEVDVMTADTADKMTSIWGTYVQSQKGFYDKLSENEQNYLLNYINNMDFKTVADILDKNPSISNQEQWLKGVIASFENSEDKIQSALNDVLSIDLDKNDYKAVEKQINEYVDNLSESLNMDKNTVKLLLNVDAVLQDSKNRTDNKNILKNRLSGNNKDNLINKYINGLTSQEVDLFINAQISDESISELQKLSSKEDIANWFNTLFSKETLNDISSITAAIETLTSREEALSTALSEQRSKGTITNETLDELKTKYSDIDKVIQHTPEGIILNEKAVAKLTKAEKDNIKQDLASKRKELKEAYQKTSLELLSYNNILNNNNDLTEDSVDYINNMIDAKSKELTTIEETIDGLRDEELAYRNLTSAHNEFINAMQSANASAGYMEVKGQFDAVKTLMEQGRYYTDDVQEYLQYMTGKDYSNKSRAEIEAAYTEARKGEEYFTDNYEGANKFLDLLTKTKVGIGENAKALAVYDEESKKYKVNIEDIDEAAEALGWSTSRLVDQLNNSSEFTNDFKYFDTDNLKNYAKEMDNVKSKIAATESEMSKIPKTSSKYKELETELSKLKKQYDSLNNAMASTVDQSNIKHNEKFIAKPTPNGDNLATNEKQKANEKHQKAKGGVLGKTTEKQEIDKTMKLYADTSSAEKSIKSITDKNYKAKVRVEIANKSEVQSWLNSVSKVKVSKGGGKLLGTTGGFAHYLGNAFASGSDIGAEESGMSLTGELGRELVVRGNRWFTVGDNGAEFAYIKKGDIVFNHRQTEQLLNGGSIGSRGQMAYASGTAYSGGDHYGVRYKMQMSSGKAGGWNGGGGSGSGGSGRGDGGSKDSSTSDKATENLFDFIEILLNRLSKTVDKMSKAVDDMVTYSKKAAQTRKTITATTSAEFYNAAANIRYNQWADYFANREIQGSGVSQAVLENYKKLLREGRIGTGDIQNITNEALRNAMTKYQEYYNKAESAADAAEDFQDQLKTLYEQLANYPIDEATEKNEKFANSIDLIEKKLRNSVTNTTGSVNAGSYTKAGNDIASYYQQQTQSLADAYNQANANLQNSKSSYNRAKDVGVRAVESLWRQSGMKSSEIMTAYNCMKNNEIIPDEVIKASKNYWLTYYLQQYNQALIARRAYEAAAEQAKQTYEVGIEENRTAAREAIKARFDDIAKAHENQISLLEARETALSNTISLLEAQGMIVDSKKYSDQIDIEGDKLSNLEQEKKELKEQLKLIEGGTQEWYDAQSALAGVETNISNANKSIAEMKNSITKLADEVQERLVKSFERVSNEFNFITDLMDLRDKIDEKTGRMTNEGLANLGSYVSGYQKASESAIKYQKLVENLQYNYQRGILDFIDSNGQRRMYNSMEQFKSAIEDTYDKWQSEIKNTYDYQSKIVDLMREKLKAELSVLKETVDKRKEALNAEKDLRSYQKSVSESTEKIGSLQRQINALKGDTSEETMARIQKLQKDLADSEEDLREKEYDRFISDQENMLDKLITQYEDGINSEMQNIQRLLSQGMAITNANLTTIASVVTEYANKYGYTMQSSDWYNAMMTASQNAVINTANGTLSKMYGFASGGLATFVKGKGEDGIAMVRKGEGIFTPEQTQAFIKQFLPSMDNIIKSANTIKDFTNSGYGTNISNENVISYNFMLQDCSNADDIIRSIQTDTRVRKALQDVTINQLSGNGTRLSVNRF